MTITIGTDPEVFLRDKNTGQFISAYGRFPGTKQEPSPLGEYGFMQVDGHALEFNTFPASSEDEFVNYVSATFNLLKEEVVKVNPNFEVALEPVANFDPLYFEMLPQDSKVLGCEPDFSSITGEALDAPPITNIPLRTSSGHIHIGWTDLEDAWDEDRFKKRIEVANKLTPHLLSVSSRWETEASRERRNYYGREGSFRPKHYGIELRILDCLWLADEDRMREVYRATYDGFVKEFPQYAS